MTGELQTWVSNRGTGFRPQRRRLFVALFIILTTALIPAIPEKARAVNLIPLLDSEIGNRPGLISYRLRRHDQARVRGQETNLTRTDHDISFFLPVARSGDNELNLYAGLSVREFETDLRFPSSGRELPDDLYRLSLGFGFEHRTEQGWIWSLVNLLNSPSNNPLTSMEVMGLNSTLVLRIPHRANNALILFLNYSSIRSSFNGAPLPGIGYWYESGEQLRTMLGLPFALDWRPTPEASLLVNYIPLRDLSASLSYKLSENLKAYLSFEWSVDSYLLANRTDNDERLYSYEKSLGLGLQVRLTRYLNLDLMAGYVFDRFLFYGHDYGNRDDDRVDLDQGLILSASLGLGFRWW